MRQPLACRTDRRADRGLLLLQSRGRYGLRVLCVPLLSRAVRRGIDTRARAAGAVAEAAGDKVQTGSVDGRVEPGRHAWCARPGGGAALAKFVCVAPDICSVSIHQGKHGPREEYVRGCNLNAPFEVSCKAACLSIRPAPILVAAWNVGGGDSDLAGDAGAAAATCSYGTTGDQLATCQSSGCNTLTSILDGIGGRRGRVASAGGSENLELAHAAVSAIVIVTPWPPFGWSSNRRSTVATHVILSAHTHLFLR